MKHRHHILPRHMGGTDDPSNIIEVTIEEHAELHLALYLEHGHLGDWLAFNSLSGQITNAERNRQRAIISARQRTYSPETREKMRQAKLGKPRPKHTEETKARMRQSSSRKPVRCIELDMTFNSASEAARVLDCSVSAVARVAAGKAKGLFLNRDKPGRGRPKYRFEYI